MAFELEEFHRNISDDELVADLVRVSLELSKKQITFRDYNRLGKYHSSTVAIRFGSWHEALKKAGLEKTIDRNIPTEDLFRNIVEVWTKLGRQPKTRDLSGGVSKFSSSTYAIGLGIGGTLSLNSLSGPTIRTFRWSLVNNQRCRLGKRPGM